MTSDNTRFDPLALFPTSNEGMPTASGRAHAETLELPWKEKEGVGGVGYARD